MKKTVASLAGLLALAGAAPALATPVYLICRFEGARAAFPIKITLNEAADSATVLSPSMDENSRSFAAFTPDQVLFSEGGRRYTIDRIDLSIVRQNLQVREPDKGKCEILAAPNRSF